MELDFDLINEEIAAGYIREERSPDRTLRILNYTQRTQFDWRWNEATMACRGLIVDNQNNVVARPFKKFFSDEQLGPEWKPPVVEHEVFDKVDGSMGVLYFTPTGPLIATRGSFVSSQAMKASSILNAKYKHLVDTLNPRKTYIFEIIYPQNRIVVDYGDMEDIVLLAVIDTETGAEEPWEVIDRWGFPRVPRLEDLDLENQSNREGYVVRYADGTRVKYKFDEYKRLHKLLTGVSEKSIWEIIRAGKSLDPLLERVPDEYFNWVKQVDRELCRQYWEIELASRNEAAAAKYCNADRKQIALEWKDHPHRAVMFAMLDDKSYSDKIWQMVKPQSGGEVFKIEASSE